MSSFRTWIHGLAAASIGAAASAVSVVVVDPVTFNFSHDGLIKLAQVTSASAILAAAAYLKQSPLPTK